jgi:triosephosphate isomerase (TIM)
MASEKRFIVQSNWKMNKTFEDGLAYLSAIRSAESRFFGSVELVLCVPFTLLRTLADAAAGISCVSMGAQNVHWEEKGAYTGEISAPMLKEAGARYCVVGHSERRDSFADTDERVQWKAKACLKQGITPIVCIGESLQERKRGQTLAKLEYQFLTCFEGFVSQDLENTVIEYEPIWAIGSGRVATPQQAGEAHQFIREMIKKYHSEETALKTRIIYGGSVKVKNVLEMSEAKDTDGVGVGSDSWDVQNFIKLAEICAQSVSKRDSA